MQALTPRLASTASSELRALSKTDAGKCAMFDNNGDLLVMLMLQNLPLDVDSRSNVDNLVHALYHLSTKDTKFSSRWMSSPNLFERLNEILRKYIGGREDEVAARFLPMRSTVVAILLLISNVNCVKQACAKCLTAGLVDSCIDLLKRDSDLSFQKDAAYALVNMTGRHHPDASNVRDKVFHTCAETLSRMVSASTTSVDALKVIVNLLEFQAEHAVTFCELGITATACGMLHNPSSEVVLLANNILAALIHASSHNLDGIVRELEEKPPPEWDDTRADTSTEPALGLHTYVRRCVGNVTALRLKLLSDLHEYEPVLFAHTYELARRLKFKGHVFTCAKELMDAAEVRKQEAEAARQAAELKRKKALGLDKIKIPHDFICPISQEVMTDPVVPSDGHSYDRSSLQAFFARPAPEYTSPLTREVLTPHMMFANHTLKKRIAAWEEETEAIATSSAAVVREQERGRKRKIGA